MVVAQKSRANALLAEETSGLIRTPHLNVATQREGHTNIVMKEASGLNRIPALSTESGPMWPIPDAIMMEIDRGNIWTLHLINIETWRSNSRWKSWHLMDLQGNLFRILLQADSRTDLVTETSILFQPNAQKRRLHSLVPLKAYPVVMVILTQEVRTFSLFFNIPVNF